MPSTKRYSEATQIILKKVLEYFQDEANSVKPLFNRNDSIIKKAARCTGVSERTLYRIKKEGIRSDKDYMEKKKKNKEKPIDERYKGVIRERVYRMFATGQNVTVNTLYEVLKEADDYPYSKSTMYKILKSIGFKWKKDEVSNRKYLMEHPDIAMKRLIFLKNFIKNRDEEKFKPVYLDETWIYSKGGFRKSWQDGTRHTVRHKSNEGVRYIVLHAGNEDGFVRNAELIFKSNSSSGDYHDAMNQQNFSKWFKEKLIPNLEEPSLIVMDNATYHNTLLEKIPCKSWTKAVLFKWLDERGIEHSKHVMKDELWRKVQVHLPQKTYELDQYALENGHKVLRLPPYHCHYNPIELVWSESKRFFDTHTSGPPNEEGVLNKWTEALAQVTSEKWRNYCSHTDKLISECWNTEKKLDASDIPRLIVCLSDESSEEESDSWDDDD